MVFLTAGFGRETAEERLDLKSPLGQTKAEELGPRWPELLNLRLARGYTVGGWTLVENTSNGVRGQGAVIEVSICYEGEAYIII